MNNKDFIQKMSDNLQMDSSEVKEKISVLVRSIVTEVEKGNTVSIQGFGNFELKEKGERRIYNPVTKDYKVVPRKLTLNLKVSSVLKDKFNK